MKRAHINLSERVIRLPDAKAGARTVYLGASAVAFLNAIPEAKRVGYVMNGVNVDKPLPFGTALHRWARLRERAGVPDGRLHDLRHTVGTFAALAGANAFAVRDLLGHRTLAMTGRYVEERAADIARAGRRMPYLVALPLPSAATEHPPEKLYPFVRSGRRLLHYIADGVAAIDGQILQPYRSAGAVHPINSTLPDVRVPFLRLGPGAGAAPLGPHPSPSAVTDAHRPTGGAAERRTAVGTRFGMTAHNVLHCLPRQAVRHEDRTAGLHTLS